MINEYAAKKYCCDDLSLIENYDKAINDNQIWHCHHRLEIHGNIKLSADELKYQDLYYDRPAYELIFLTRTEHMSLHNQNRTEEHKHKISEANKANKNTKGKHWEWTEESKKRQSILHTGKPLPKNKWKTPDGNIIEMAKNNVVRYHKDWVLVE